MSVALENFLTELDHAIDVTEIVAQPLGGPLGSLDPARLLRVCHAAPAPQDLDADNPGPSVKPPGRLALDHPSVIMLGNGDLAAIALLARSLAPWLVPQRLEPLSRLRSVLVGVVGEFFFGQGHGVLLVGWWFPL